MGSASEFLPSPFEQSTERPLPLNATKPLRACDTAKDCNNYCNRFGPSRYCYRLCKTLTFCDTVPKKDQKKPKEEVTASGKQKAYRSGPEVPAYFQMKKGVCNDKKDCTKTEDCTVLKYRDVLRDQTDGLLKDRIYTAPRKCQDGKCVWTGEVKFNTTTRTPETAKKLKW